MHGFDDRMQERPDLPSPSVGIMRRNHRKMLEKRMVAEETPIALVYDGTTAAVLMASPCDLEDFAVGFSLTEGIVESASEIEQLDVVRRADGIELRMWLTADSGRRFKKRQRRLIGPTGCGLCGLESLAEINRYVPRLKREISLRSGQIEDAVEALSSAQQLNHITHATHAAGFYRPVEGLTVLREDVGRHNALDKLAGALHAGAGRTGAIVLTSRVSIEMVQKTASIGSPILIAISAPTALAVRAAETFGITLVAIARKSSFEVFTCTDGIVFDDDAVTTNPARSHANARRLIDRAASSPP